MGFDRNAPKQPVSFDLNEDLVRKASALTEDLASTLEVLLDEFVVRQNSVSPSENTAFARFVHDWAAYHAKHGLLSDDVADL